MSEDRLKNYIDQHRQEFDTEHPPAHSWVEIEKTLDQSLHRHRGIKFILPRLLKVAASVFLLLSAGAGMAYYMQVQKTNNVALAIQNPDNRKEFTEASNYFTSQIDAKIAELQTYTSSSTIIEELNQIDQVSDELKLEILKNPDQDQDILVKEMILQYQQKLTVLNKILTKLKNNEQPSSSQKSNSKHDTLHL